MNNTSDVVLFIVTVLVVMLLVQSYRFAAFIKKTEGKEYWTILTMIVLIFSPSTETMGVFKYYITLLSGAYFSAYKRGYLAEKELSEIPDEQYESASEILDKEQYFIREFFYPSIAEPFLTVADNSSEFRHAVKTFLSQISRTEHIDGKPGFVANINKQIREFAEEENMTRREILDMMSTYLSNMDEKFINRKIKEYRE